MAFWICDTGWNLRQVEDEYATVEDAIAAAIEKYFRADGRERESLIVDVGDHGDATTYECVAVVIADMVYRRTD